MHRAVWLLAPIAVGCGHLLTVSDQPTETPDGGGLSEAGASSSSSGSDASSSSGGGTSGNLINPLGSIDAGPDADAARCLHDDGIGDGFPDCDVAPGTYTKDLAIRACQAYQASRVGNGCVLGSVAPGGDLTGCAPDVIAALSGSVVAVWAFAGTAEGWFRQGAVCPQPQAVDGNVRWH